MSDYTHDGDVGFIGGLTLPSAGLRVNYRNQFAAYTHRSASRNGFNEVGVQVGSCGRTGGRSTLVRG